MIPRPDQHRGILPVAAVLAAAVVVLGICALLGVGPFANNEPFRLEVPDRLGDCREAGRDAGDRCDPAADIEMVEVWQSDDGTLIVELVLTAVPEFGSELEWTAQFYVDTQNAYTEGGIICGLSNVFDGPEPGTDAVSYALEPNTVPRRPLSADACHGRLRDSSARFSIDVTGQPDDAEFRVIGLVRLEYPGDPDHPGSEDDFLVRTSLADLQRLAD